MNYRFVIRRLGLLFAGMGAAMAVVALIELVGLTRETGSEYVGLTGLSIAAGTAILAGLLMWRLAGTGADQFLGRREALLLVGLSWLVGAAMAALPFWIWGLVHTTSHPFRSFAACYFEAMSGLTTTGSTVLSNVEGVPKSLLLWRSTTHWIGGLGIVVLFVAIWPTLGVGGRKLFAFESSGKTGMDVQPRIRHTARLLWLVYLGLTLSEILLLRLCGPGFLNWAPQMTWFNAVCESFGTLASGGFSNLNASTAGYRSLAVELVELLFMFLTGINYGLFLLMLRGRFRVALGDPELRMYMITSVVGTLIVAVSLVNHVIVLSLPAVTEMASILPQSSPAEAGVTVPGTVLNSLRHAAFQVISIRTTTGFVTADFNAWPFIAQTVLIVLMFIGGCHGSTGGGVKVIRFLVLLKTLGLGVERMFRPNVVRPLKIGAMNVETQMRLDTMVFLMLFIGVCLAASVLIVMFEQLLGDGTIDYTTAVTAAIATINNIGPGLGRVGAVNNYGWFSSPSLVTMSLLMIIGRLELYAILVLCLPRFWRGG